jgi:hypothetical protein
VWGGVQGEEEGPEKEVQQALLPHVEVEVLVEEKELCCVILSCHAYFCLK